MKQDVSNKVLYDINDVIQMTSTVFNNKLSWDEIKQFGNGVFIDEILNLGRDGKTDNTKKLTDENNKTKTKDNYTNQVERSF